LGVGDLRGLEELVAARSELGSEDGRAILRPARLEKLEMCDWDLGPNGLGFIDEERFLEELDVTRDFLDERMLRRAHLRKLGMYECGHQDVVFYLLATLHAWRC